MDEVDVDDSSDTATASRSFSRPRRAMGPPDEALPSAPRRTFALARSLPGHVFRKYRAMHPAGKLAIVFLVLFYIALGTFIIIIRPARIAQFMYNLAQRLSHHPLGWLMLGGIIGASAFSAEIRVVSLRRYLL